MLIHFLKHTTTSPLQGRGPPLIPCARPKGINSAGLFGAPIMDQLTPLPQFVLGKRWPRAWLQIFRPVAPVLFEIASVREHAVRREDAI